MYSLTGSWISLNNALKRDILREARRGLRPEEVALEAERERDARIKLEQDADEAREAAVTREKAEARRPRRISRNGVA